MSTSGRELNKGRTLKSNYAKRKKMDFIWKKKSACLICLMPDFYIGLASSREASEPQGKGKRLAFYSFHYFLPDSKVKGMF